LFARCANFDAARAATEIFPGAAVASDAEITAYIRRKGRKPCITR